MGNSWCSPPRATVASASTEENSIDESLVKEDENIQSRRLDGMNEDVWSGGVKDGIQMPRHQKTKRSEHDYAKKESKWIRKIKSNLAKLRKQFDNSVHQNSFVEYQLLEIFYDELTHILQQIADTILTCRTETCPTIGSFFPRILYSERSQMEPFKAKKEYMDFQVTLSEILFQIKLALDISEELEDVTRTLSQGCVSVAQQASVSTSSSLPNMYMMSHRLLSIANAEHESSNNEKNEMILAERIVACISYAQKEMVIYQNTAGNRPPTKNTIRALKNINHQIEGIQLKLDSGNRLHLQSFDNLPLKEISERWFDPWDNIRSFPWTLGEWKLDHTSLSFERIERHITRAKQYIKLILRISPRCLTDALDDTNTDSYITTLIEQLGNSIKAAIDLGDQSIPSMARLGELSSDTFKNEFLQDTLQGKKTRLQTMLQHLKRMRELLKQNERSERNSTHSDPGVKELSPTNVTLQLDLMEQQKRKKHALTVLSHFRNKRKNEKKESHLDVYKKGENLEDIVILGYDKSVPFRRQIYLNEEGVEIRIKNPFDVSDEALRFRTMKGETKGQMLERKSLDLIYECIQQNSSFLWQTHSNLTIITGDYLKSVEGKPKEVICIVLYCLSKGYIPLNEAEFPKELSCHLGSLPTDVREGYFVPGPTNLFGGRDSYNDPVCMGSNIGVDERGEGGSLGLFIDLKNNKKAFITCSHVLFDCIGPNPFKYRRRPDKTEHKVVQPSTNTWCGQLDRMCGVVNKAIFKPNTSPVSVDAGLVELTTRVPSTGHFVIKDERQVREIGYTMDKLPAFESGIVRRKIYDVDIEKPLLKSGSSTGLTRSLFRLDGAEVRIFEDGFWMIHGSKELIVMKGQYEVETRSDLKSFFEQGDSGSAVFIKDGTLACIGMGIGITSYRTTIVTPIGPILDSLDLQDVEVTRFT